MQSRGSIRGDQALFQPPFRRRALGWQGRLILGWGVVMGGSGVAVRLAVAQVDAEYELPPIRYSATSPSNQVTAVQGELEAGRLGWRGASEKEKVRECLGALGVSPDTQVLVYSKTSLQRQRIEPRNPRAIYFSDDCYVGWVPGGLAEVAVSDPALGLAFYRMDLGAARFERDGECLSCHAGAKTRNWPGVMVRSVFPDARGEPISRAGSFLVGHETPLSERWGGWYVTGRHGSDRHLGNAIARETEQGAELDRESGANVTDLSRFFPTGNYPRPDSDIVALMVLEHQVAMHSRLVEGALRVRKWSHYQEQLQKELGQEVSAEPSGTARRVIDHEAERIVEYLLFCDEFALKAPVEGGAPFVEAFRRNRKPDAGGRSLKDLDLRTRLFTYRCSYMVYSLAFESLPATLKAGVARRLTEILTRVDPGKRFAHLGVEERRAIREILVATKPGLLPGWE